MSGASVLPFLYGALATSSVVATLFFLRFWKTSGDRLFGFFFVAFWLLAVDWAAPVLLLGPQTSRVAVYLLRLAAFVLIIVGVVDKNRRGR